MHCQALPVEAIIAITFVAGMVFAFVLVFIATLVD